MTAHSRSTYRRKLVSGDAHQGLFGLVRDQRLVTIDMLPDNALVEIFDSYLNIDDRRLGAPRNTWHALVHVCRRWRCLVFASPRRLNLRLKYRGHRPMSDVLDIWPVLPVILISNVEVLLSLGELPYPRWEERWDNRVAVLESEHYNRICEIHIFDMTKSRLARFAAAMQKRFPELTHLEVLARGDSVPVLPDLFLGGSAPRLQQLSLGSISFPSMPKLLLSANRLVTLSLLDIPDSGYIPPDAMATALQVMTTLETLHLRFRSHRSPSIPNPGPASRPLPPPTRFVLPALTEIIFAGVYEYLEDLLARIDAPLLYTLLILYFMSLNFDVPQLHRLIGHAEKFKTFNRAKILIFDRPISLKFYPDWVVNYHSQLALKINCGGPDWQLSSLAQVCSSSFHLISTLKTLEIEGSPSHWGDDTEDTQWVELLEPFSALKNLYLTRGIARRVCGALGKLSEERATEILPVLRKLFVDGSRPFEHIQEAIRPFVAARQLSGHPVAIDRWRGKR